MYNYNDQGPSVEWGNNTARQTQAGFTLGSWLKQLGHFTNIMWPVTCYKSFKHLNLQKTKLLSKATEINWSR